MKNIYLILAIAGLLIPFYFIFQFMTGPLAAGGIGGFLEATTANNAALTVMYDVLIFFAAAYIWMVTEVRRLKMKNGWIFLLLPFVSPIAFAFPIFMYARERNEGR